MPSILSVNRDVTFVVAVNDRRVLTDNFLASPCMRGPGQHEVLLQEGFGSAAAAYNAAIDRSAGEVIVFCHQDIFLPEPWMSQLQRALDRLQVQDPEWGVLGCGGVTRDGCGRGHIYSTGAGVLGQAFDAPAPVQTLDEVVLIIRKSSGLRFDPTLPHFHQYGADICLRAASRGMYNYAISAFCIHNTRQVFVLPREYYTCCRHIISTWRDYLPVETTCVRLTRSNLPMYGRRVREAYLRYIRKGLVGAERRTDVAKLVDECERAIQGHTC